jgi:hypothetical protein
VLPFLQCSYSGQKKCLSIDSVTIPNVYILRCSLFPEQSFCREGQLHMCLQFLKWCCFSVRPPAAAQCVFVLEIWAWFSTTARTGLWSPCWEPSLTYACIYLHAAYVLMKKCLLGFVCPFSHLPWRPWREGNAPSWAILLSLERLSDFMVSYHFSTIWSNSGSNSLQQQTAGYFHSSISFWWNKDLI